jgi:hypothetical protein
VLHFIVELAGVICSLHWLEGSSPLDCFLELWLTSPVDISRSFIDKLEYRGPSRYCCH